MEKRQDTLGAHKRSFQSEKLGDEAHGSRHRSAVAKAERDYQVQYQTGGSSLDRQQHEHVACARTIAPPAASQSHPPRQLQSSIFAAERERCRRRRGT